MFNRGYQIIVSQFTFSWALLFIDLTIKMSQCSIIVSYYLVYTKIKVMVKNEK